MNMDVFDAILLFQNIFQCILVKQPLFIAATLSTQPAITCSNLAIETSEQDVKFVQS